MHELGEVFAILCDADLDTLQLVRDEIDRMRVEKLKCHKHLVDLGSDVKPARPTTN
jgi:hypothetical protein